jgi:hypothetical protein
MAAVFRFPAATLVAGGQACFVAMMAACLAIEPSWLAVKRGLSFYGNDLHTIVPFALGFVLCIGLTTVGLVRFGARDAFRRHLRAVLAVMLALMALIPLTPYSVDLFFDYAHTAIASLLFGTGFVVGAWLALRVLRGRLACGSFSVQTCAGVVALAAQLGWLDYMIPSQLVFQIALALLIVLGILHRAPRA